MSALQNQCERVARENSGGGQSAPSMTKARERHLSAVLCTFPAAGF